MSGRFDRLKQLAVAAAKQAKLRKRLTLILAVVLFLQIYFVRELIAAELLFGLGFLFLFLLVVVFYTIGYVGEQSFGWLEAGIRASTPAVRRESRRWEARARTLLPMTRQAYAHLQAQLRLAAPIAQRIHMGIETRARELAPIARRGYTRLEELSKRPFRHPRSESVQ